MAKHEISIDINPAFKVSLKVTPIKKLVEQILKIVSPDEVIELSVVFTDNTTIQALNKKHRNIDSPTDVLAFHMQPDDNNNIVFITPPDSIHHLGELVISYPKAVSQAGEYGHSVDYEIAILLIHGILHLFGHDHELDEEEELMRAKEAEILKRLTISGD